MPGKRLYDSSLIRTTFTELVANGGEFLGDWDGLVEARPVPVKLIGNAWWQGSYDGITYSDTVENDHTYTRLSTDGGETWLVFDMQGLGGDSHPPVTIGSPSGGLSISGDDTQVLTLLPATTTTPGSLSATDKVRIDNIKWYDVANVGAGSGIYKDSTTVGDDVTFNMKTLVAGTGVTITPSTDTITIDATGAGGGEVNTGSNQGTLGFGVFDGKVGVDLQFRHIALDAAETALQLSLDDTNNNIELSLDQTLVDHDVLNNYDPNEHVDHTAVSILTQEGITGGGDLTATRTLTLSFDTLTQQVDNLDTDVFAFYRNDSGEDEHFGITFSDMKVWVKQHTDIYYVPIETSVLAGLGLSGGGSLENDVTLYLDINGLPTTTYDANDYVAVYDTSALTHAKVTLNDLIGELAVSITAGDGMDFTTITSTGPVTLGTPSTVTEATTNSVTTTSHTHEFTLANLTYITDVDGTPTSGEYLKWNGTTWVTDDPAIGATTPGLPLNSIQYNSANTFAGDAGLLYDPTTDTIKFSDPNTNGGATFIFGTDSSDPKIIGDVDSTNSIVVDVTGAPQNYFQVVSGRIALGQDVLDADTFLDIKDNNALGYTYTARISNTLDEEMFKLSSTGNLYLAKLSSASADNILYYDTTTGLVTYGAAPDGGGGGVTTLLADSLSGMMVNGGNTSSASTIELDQNDNKLVANTIELTDYIGFWDVSATTQAKTLLGDVPMLSLQLNGIAQETLTIGESLNITSGSNTTIGYESSTNTYTFNADVPLFPPYTHQPKAIISFWDGLYTYDIVSGTAYKLINAPTANYHRDTTIGIDDKIYVADGTSLRMYDITNDTTTTSTGNTTSIIFRMIHQGDYLYLFSENRCWYVNINDVNLTINDYGDTAIEAAEDGGAAVIFDSTGGVYYIVAIDNVSENFRYKEVKGTYSGADTDAFSNRTFNRSTHYAISSELDKILAFDGDNKTYFVDMPFILTGTGTLTTVDTYVTPSGHGWGGDGEITTLKANRERPLSLFPTAYTIVDTTPSGTYSEAEAAADLGIYMGDNNIGDDTDNKWSQVVQTQIPLHDIHVDESQVASGGVNVIVGGTGNVWFKAYNESPGQFTSNHVHLITDPNLTQATQISDSIDFVYYHSTYTASDLDPKDVSGTSYLDLYVNSVLEKEDTPKLDLIEGTNITLAYTAEGKVTINAATNSGVINTANSITGDGALGTPAQLVNDEDTPGNSQYYGTDAAGTKGYHDFPLEDIAFEFADLAGGTTQYTLDIKASFDYEIVNTILETDDSVSGTVTGGSATINFSNVGTLTEIATTSTVTTGDRIYLNITSAGSATTIRGKLVTKRL